MGIKVVEKLKILLDIADIYDIIKAQGGRVLSSPNVGVDPEPIFLRIYCTLKRNAGVKRNYK
jgi:hypothetical protein